MKFENLNFRLLSGLNNLKFRFTNDKKIPFFQWCKQVSEILFVWATGEAFNCVKWRINSLFTFEEARDHDSNGSFRSFRWKREQM